MHRHLKVVVIIPMGGEDNGFTVETEIFAMKFCKEPICRVGDLNGCILRVYAHILPSQKTFLKRL